MTASDETSPGEPNPFDLDDTVHQRSRLGILTILREAGEADFAFLKKTLGLTDGNLGRHLDVLATAGYIATRRGYDGRRSRTWVSLTPQGATALDLEVAALRAIIDRANPPA